MSCLPDFSDEQRIAFKVGIMPVQQHNGKPIFPHSTFDAVIVAFSITAATKKGGGRCAQLLPVSQVKSRVALKLL